MLQTHPPWLHSLAVSALPGHPAAPWTKETRAAPLAPALPRSSGNTHRVKGEGGHRSAKWVIWEPGCDTGTVIASLPHFQPATESPVLGADRAGTKSLLPALATQKAAKGSSLLQNTPAWPCMFLTALSTGQAAALTSPAGWEVLLAGTSPWPQPHPPHALAELLSLGSEGVHIWLAVKSGEPLASTHRYPAAQPGGVKACLEPCWGEQWGWLAEEGHRQPAPGLVCTMHGALER